MGIWFVFHLSFIITAGKSQTNINLAFGKRALYRVEDKLSEVVLSKDSLKDISFQYLIIDLSSLNWIIDMTVEISGQNLEKLEVNLKGHSLHGILTHPCVLVYDEGIKGIYGCQKLSRFVAFDSQNETARLISIDIQGYESYTELYVGCFRVIEKGGKTQKFDSLFSCIMACKDKSFLYAGSKFNIECICITNEESMIPLPLVQCRSTCGRRNGQICGGTDFAVYSTNVTLLGKNVTLTKDCAFNESYCRQCDQGLVGISCFYRDCDISNGGCKTKCISLNAVPTIIRNSFSFVKHGLCFCDDGFKFTSDGSCVDADECAGNLCGNDSSKCENLNGTYSCTCSPGYENETPQLCVDQDECMSDPCKSNTECANSVGSFECWCLSGYEQKSQYECKDIDECSLGKSECSKGLICSNTIGSYRCVCAEGKEVGHFNGETICQDENQCEGDHSCDLETSECVDLPKNYFCRCLYGYVSVGPMQCQKENPNSTMTKETIDLDEYYNDEEDSALLTFFGKNRILKIVGTTEGRATASNYAFASFLILTIAVLSTVVSRRYIVKLGKRGMPAPVMI